jgi:hypothetical protein
LTPSTSGTWTKDVLHNFGSNSDGGYVWAGLTFSNEVLYGATTGYGGEVGDGGTVFQLTPPGMSGTGWREASLYVFPSDNGFTEGPYGTLLAARRGRFSA